MNKQIIDKSSLLYKLYGAIADCENLGLNHEGFLISMAASCIESELEFDEKGNITDANHKN